MKLVAVGRRTFVSFISSHGRPRPRPPSPSRRFFSSLQQQETEERGPFSDKLLRLADQIAGLSNPELSRMSTDLRRMLGLPEPSATMGPMPGFDGASLEAAPAQEEEKPPEKTSFDLRIEKFEAASKIKVIKEVRAFTNLGLKEAKELVEKVPTVFKTGVEKEEALQIIEKLKLAGATVIME